MNQIHYTPGRIFNSHELLKYKNIKYHFSYRRRRQMALAEPTAISFSRILFSKILFSKILFSKISFSKILSSRILFSKILSSKILFTKILPRIIFKDFISKDFYINLVMAISDRWRWRRQLPFYFPTFSLSYNHIF